MSTPVEKLWGAQRWHRLIAQTKLKSGDKVVLYAMLGWVDWEDHTNDTLWPSNESIAKAAGMESRSVGRVLKRLANKGMIEIMGDRKGGRDAKGRPRTNVTRLCEDGLRALRYDNGSGLEPANCDNESIQGRPSVASTPTLDPANPGRKSDNQTIKSDQSEQTTTTDGGGVDIDVLNEERAVRLLTDEGVSFEHARLLAKDHSPEAIRAVIDNLRWHSSKRGYGPGLIVKQIRAGEGEELLIKRQHKQAKKERRELTEKRAERLGRLLDRIEADTKHAEAAEPLLANVRAVWPTVESLADAGVVDDKALFDPDARAWDLFNIIWAEANRRLDESEKSAEGCQEATVLIDSGHVDAA